MFLNVAETHSMLITSHNRHNYFMGSSIRFISRLESNEVEIRKYLEVHIDEKLNWKEHINEVSVKILHTVGFLKYSKHYPPISAVSSLYNSIVEPYFLYYCSVWGCCSATEIQHLQRL